MNGILGGGLNEILAGLVDEIPDGAIYREKDMIQGGENYEIHGGAMDYFLGGNEDEIPETEQDIVSTVYPPIFINVQGNDYEISLGQNIMEPRDEVSLVENVAINDDGYEISTVLPPLDLTGKNKGEDFLREEPPPQPYGNIFANNEIISTVSPPLVIKLDESDKQSTISDYEIQEEKEPDNEVPEEKQNIVTRLPGTEIKHSRKQNPTENPIGEEQMKNTHNNKEEIKTKKKGKLFNFLYGDTNQMQINANKIKLDTDGNIIDGEFNQFTSINM